MRLIDTLRAHVVDYTKIKSYFNTLDLTLREYKYLLDGIYNADETGFSIGTTCELVILIDRLDKLYSKC